MTLREIAAIAGKPGLYRIVKPTRTGVIIEAIDETRKRDVASAQAKVSLLNEITVYTTTVDGSVPLRDLLKKAYELYPNGNGVTSKSEGAAFQEFMAAIAPDFDRERVYTSDIKKISNWFNTLLNLAPEVFLPEESEAAETVKEPVAAEAVVEEPVIAEKAPKAKKAKKTE